MGWIQKMKEKIKPKTKVVESDDSIMVDGITSWNQRKASHQKMDSVATTTIKVANKKTNVYWFSTDVKKKTLLDKMETQISSKDKDNNELEKIGDNIIYWLHDEQIFYNKNICTYKKIDRIIEVAHRYFKRNQTVSKNSFKNFILNNYVDIFDVNKINQLDMRDDFFYSEGAIDGENGIGYGYFDGRHQLIYLPVFFDDTFKFYSTNQIKQLDANFVDSKSIQQWVASYLTNQKTDTLDLTNGIFVFVPAFDAKFDMNQELYQRRLNQYIKDCYDNKWIVTIQQLKSLEY